MGILDKARSLAQQEEKAGDLTWDDSRGWRVVRGQEADDLPDKFEDHVLEGLRRNPVVAACVREMQTSISEAPIHVFDDDEDKNTRIKDHPLEELFKQPNRRDSYVTFIERSVQHFLLGGNSFWFKIRENGVPTMLVPIRPDLVTGAQTDSHNFPSSFTILKSADSTEEIEVPFDDIVHIPDADPLNEVFGMPRVLSATLDIATDNEASNYVNEVLGNFGSPGTIVTIDSERAKRSMLERAEALWQQKFGPGRGRGKVAFIPGGQQVQQIGFNLRDLEFEALRQVTRESICFEPGTEVFTSQGWKNIEYIKEGDRVLTHKGRFKEVEGTTSRDYEGDLVEINPAGLESVRCTPNHPWYVSKWGNNWVDDEGNHVNEMVKEESPQWVSAEKLIGRKRSENTGRFLAGSYHRTIMPSLESDESLTEISLLVPEFTDDSVIIDEDTLTYMNPRAHELPRFVGLTEEFGRLVGLYVAEGCTGGPDTAVHWNFGAHEDDLVNEAVNSIQNIFGLEASVKDMREYGTSTKIVAVYSRILNSFFKQFGHKAHNKIFPEWVMKAPQEFRDAVLEGYVDGDGCYHEKTKAFSITTVSEDLAWQVRLLVWNRGDNATAHVRERNKGIINGREVNQKDCYQVRWNPERAWGHVRFTENTSEFYLEESEKVPHLGKVYNLHVKDDESYVTKAGATHNCAAFGIDPMVVNISTAGRGGTMSGNEHKEARRKLWTQTLIPMIRRWEAALNAFLTPEFGNVHVRFNLENVTALQEDRDSQIDRARKMVQAGASLEEARAEMGFDPDPDPEDHFVLTGRTDIFPVSLITEIGARRDEIQDAVDGDGDSGSGDDGSDDDDDGSDDDEESDQNSGPPSPLSVLRKDLLRWMRENPPLNKKSGPLSPGEGFTPDGSLVRENNTEDEDRAWKQVDGFARSQEAGYRLAAEDIFEKQRRDVLRIAIRVLEEGESSSSSDYMVETKQVDPDSVEKLRDELEELYDRYDDEWQRRFEPLYEQSADSVAARLSGVLGVGLTLNEFVRRFIRVRLGGLVELNQRTKEGVFAVLSDIADNDISFQNSLRNIQSVFDEGTTYTSSAGKKITLLGVKERSELVARTESTEITNGSALNMAKGTAIDWLKLWLSMRDNKVRPTHAAEDDDSHAQPVPQNEPFRVTGRDFPGGWRCRCTILFRQPENEENP